MDEKLQEIIDYLELKEGYSKKEVIDDIVLGIKELKGNSPDEIGVEWDGEHLMVLEDFAEEFYDQVIKKVCNVINSYKESNKD